MVDGVYISAGLTVLLHFHGSVVAVVMPTVLSGFCMFCLMLRVGPALSSCTTAVSVLDLGCHLQWNCSDVDSSTTFTVQKKSQGEEWQNVSRCFQISSYICDVSQAFPDFDLYNLIRVGLSQGHGGIQWTAAQLCDPLQNPNARFSPPTASVSLEERRLWVNLEFPCAPSAACPIEEEEEVASPSCCPLTRFLHLNTTVTLYNKHDAAETQTRTEVFDCIPARLEFLKPVGGVEYCAVARFASSPPSEPQCFLVQSPESLKFAMLSGALIALLIVACVLGRWWASSDARLPKSLMSLQNVDQENPFVGQSGQPALEEEEEVSMVVLSIVPLSSLSALSKALSSSSSSRSLGRGYYASPILQHQGSNEHGDGASHLEMDGDASLINDPGHQWASEAAHRTGPAYSLDAALQLGDSSIPLTSVRVAEVEPNHFPKLLMYMNTCVESPSFARRDCGENEV